MGYLVAPQRASPTALGVGHQAQAPEVDFGQLARLALGHAHRHASPLGEPAVLHGEPVQRAVGNLDAVTPQQLVHLRQAKTPLLACSRLQPPLDPGPMGQQPLFDPASTPAPGRMVTRRDERGQFLRRLLRPRPPPKLHRRRDVAPHRRAAMARRAGHRRLALSPANTPEHVQHLPHGNPSIRHLPHLPRSRN